jgi:hypothetical protein
MPARNSKGQFKSSGTGQSGIRWTSDTLTPGLRMFAPKVHAAIGAAMKFHEPQVESYMKTNAVWTDRTSNARNGLTATYVFDAPSTHVIVCYHMMPYGIWLEIANAGRFRIIIPTIINQGREVMLTIAGLLRKMK